MTGLRLAVVALVSTGLIAAGCGGDGGEEGEDGDDAAAVAVPGAEEAASLQQEIADLSDEEQIERVGEAWAEPFAAGDEAMCGYLHPDLGGASSCAEYSGGASTGSTQLQRLYAGATVDNVEVTGETAVADFSNGEQVTFGQDPDGAWKVTKIAF